MECSSRRKYKGYGVRRLCNNCQVDMDGHNLYVRRRIYRQAGYPHATFETLRREDSYGLGIL